MCPLNAFAHFILSAFARNFPVEAQLRFYYGRTTGSPDSLPAMISSFVPSALGEPAMRSLGSFSAATVALALLAGGALAIAPPRPTPRTDRYGDPLPPGAEARLGTIRLRHRWPHGVLVQFTNDGTALRSTCGDGAVYYWDARTGAERRRLATVRAEPPGAIGLSPDGRLLAAAVSDPQASVVVWDTALGREQARCLRAANTLDYVAVSPDGKRVAAVASPGEVIVWDLPTGRLLYQRACPSGARNLLFTRIGTLVVKSEDGPVYLWDEGMGRELRRFPGCADRDAGGLAVSPDGMLLAVGEDRSISLYDLRSGADLRHLTADGRPGYGMVFSGDSRRLVSTQGRNLRVWEVPSGRVVHSFPGPADTAYSLDLSPDGTLVAAGLQQAVHVYDLRTGREVQPRDAPEREMRWVAFTPDGSALATVDCTAGGTFGLWDPATGRRLQSWPSASFEVFGRFVPGGGFLFVPALRDHVQLRDWRTGRELRRFALAEKGGANERYDLTGLELSPDKERFTAFAATPRLVGAAGGLNMRFTWEVATGRKQIGRPFAPFLSLQNRSALAPGARLLAVSDEIASGFLHLHDVETAAEVACLPVGDVQGNRFIFSPDGTLLAAVCDTQQPAPGFGSKQTVSIWEVATGLLVNRLEPVQVWHDVAFSADGRLLATGPGADAPIQLWDLATGEEVGHWQGHTAAVSALDFAPDSSRLATAHWDGTVLVWDITSAVRRLRRPAPGSADRDRLWSDLAGEDGRKAQAAIWALAAAPGPALELFGRRLRPKPLAREDIPRLIARLDSGRYADRDDATRRLEALGSDAAPALRKALDGQPSAELRRRVGALLAHAHALRSGEDRRRVRAVRVLERIGSPEARRLLSELAAGPARLEAPWQARAALGRLATWSAVRPLPAGNR
jgi:WD40 repeat protein